MERTRQETNAVELSKGTLKRKASEASGHVESREGTKLKSYFFY